MKRKFAVVAGILIACMGLSGCQKDVPDEIDTEDVIQIERNESIPNIFEMTKEEILALSPEEVKASVEEWLPNYREAFRIKEDRVMTDEDWLTVREIICLSLYGSASLEDDYLPEEEIDGVDYSDPNWIYIAPTAAYVESLTPFEFEEYLVAYGNYWAKEEDPDYVPVEYEYGKVSEEDLSKLQAVFAEELKAIENGDGSDIAGIVGLNGETSEAEDEVDDETEEALAEPPLEEETSDL